MPAIDFSIPHSLNPDDVVSRLKTFLDKVRERNDSKFQLKSDTWEGNHLKCAFSSFGFSMDADMQVLPSELKFHLEIPFAAMMFKGQIQQRLRDELGKLLGESKA